MTLDEFCEARAPSEVVGMMAGSLMDRLVFLRDGRVWQSPGYMRGDSRFGIAPVTFPGGWCPPVPGTPAGKDWARESQQTTTGIPSSSSPFVGGERPQ